MCSSPEIDDVIPRFNSMTIQSSPAGYVLPHSLLTESLDSELDAIVYTLQQNNQLERRKPKTKKLLGNPRPEPTFRSLGCKGKSHHKYRRFENGNPILNLKTQLFHDQLLQLCFRPKQTTLFYSNYHLNL